MTARLAHYTKQEGGQWFVYQGKNLSKDKAKVQPGIFAAHFSDGEVWDNIAGVRKTIDAAFFDNIK